MKCTRKKVETMIFASTQVFNFFFLLFVVNKCRLYRDCSFSERNFDFSLYIDSQNAVFHNITKFCHLC